MAMRSGDTKMSHLVFIALILRAFGALVSSAHGRLQESGRCGNYGGNLEPIVTAMEKFTYARTRHGIGRTTLSHTKVSI